MRTRSATALLVLALAGCRSAGATDAWTVEEPTVSTPEAKAHSYPARAAREVEVLEKAPSNAELLSTKLVGREAAGRSAADDLRAAAAALGADCVVVTSRSTYATEVAMGSKQWEVLRGSAYRRSR